MKIGVAATGGSLDAEASDAFGRCRYFLIIDSETMNFEAFTNPAAGMTGGAGPAAVREIVNRGAELVLAGRSGPKAEHALSSAGILFQTASGKVRDAVTNLNK